MSWYSPYTFETVPLTVTRRRVFISYFHGDRVWAQSFVNQFGGAGGVFLPRALGLDFVGADKIDSRDPDYVMDQIRERCITDSSVQIVLIGPCTHSRRYIDWEIKRSLRAGNGLLGICLPPHISAHLPERFAANCASDGSGFSRFYLYPETADRLRDWIEEAYLARSSRRHLMKNTNEVWAYNRLCNVCGFTH